MKIKGPDYFGNLCTGDRFELTSRRRIFFGEAARRLLAYNDGVIGPRTSGLLYLEPDLVMCRPPRSRRKGDSQV